MCCFTHINVWYLSGPVFPIGPGYDDNCDAACLQSHTGCGKSCIFTSYWWPSAKLLYRQYCGNYWSYHSVADTTVLHWAITAPGRCQAIIWTNAGILLIWTLGTNISGILIKIHTFLAATKQLYKWYFPSVRLSVRPSVRPSVCPSVRHTFLTMFPSSDHHEIFRSYYQWPT